MKIICCFCLIIYKTHNKHLSDDNDKYIIKYKRKIDIDGNDIDTIFYFICCVCKKVFNINKSYIFP
jgi:hypothetical protein